MLEFLRNSIHSWWVRSIFIAIILVFIFLGLGSNNSNTQILATVNGNALSVHSFLQALDSEKKQFLANNPSLTDEILEQLGIRNQVFERLVTRLLFIQEATKLGLFVTPYEVQQSLFSLPFFKNEEGNFDIDLYKKALENNKTAVLLFEQELSDDVLINKLVKLITDSAFVNEKYAKILYGYFNEERSIEYLLFPKKNYIKDITLTEEEIQDYYKKNSYLWKQPSQLAINYITLSKEALLPQVNVSEEEILSQYEENSTSYSTLVKEKALELIKQQLFQEKTNSLIEGYLEKINTSSNTSSIQSIAKELSLPLETTDLLTKEQAIVRLNFQENIFEELLNSVTKSIEAIPSKKEGEYLIVEVQEKILESITPFEDVEKDVFHALQDEKSLELANIAAKRSLDEITKKDKKIPSPSTTSLFSRIAQIPEPFSDSTELSDAIFNNAKNTLLPTPYEYPDGVAIIKVAHVAPASEKNWEEDKITFTKRVLELRQQELVNLIEKNLRTKARIAIKIPELLKN